MLSKSQQGRINNPLNGQFNVYKSNKIHKTKIIIQTIIKNMVKNKITYLQFLTKKLSKPKQLLAITEALITFGQRNKRGQVKLLS